VAVARAIVTEPALVLADEPTGNLDTLASDEVMAIFSDLNAAGRTVVLITHEAEIAEYAGRVVRMRDGLIIADAPTRTATATATATEPRRRRPSEALR
jgi:putative ABC transport system ATP-binding protein